MGQYDTEGFQGSHDDEKQQLLESGCKCDRFYNFPVGRSLNLVQSDQIWIGITQFPIDSIR